MRSLLVRLTVTGVVGLVLFIASSLYRAKRGETRFAAARAHATVMCKAARSTPEHVNASRICGDDAFAPTSLPIYVGAKRDLDLADAWLAAGDDAAASNALVSAASATGRMQRVGGALAAIAAATVVRCTLDTLARHPRLDRAAVLSRLELDPANRVLQDMTADRLWVLAHWNEHAGLMRRSEAALAEEMEGDERAFAGMERALVDQDLAACSRAAAKSSEGGLQVMVCPKLFAIVEAEQRLAAARHQIFTRLSGER